jgi:hypothetical protein
MLFATYQLAEQCHMTVRQLRREIDLHELTYWHGYRRYKAALEDQAREKAKMQRDQEREAAKQKGHARRQR